MSLSKPFFNNAPKAKKLLPIDGIADKDFAKLHWTRQLELRPLSSRKRWENNTDGDYNNLIDNFDTDEEREEK